MTANSNTNSDSLKPVEWTISDAHIVPGKGKDAKGKQPIFTITGTIKRSDSTTNETQKGKEFEWTPEIKNKGYTLDLTKFNKETGTGTIVVKGTIKKGGRTKKEAATGKTLNDMLDLA